MNIKVCSKCGYKGDADADFYKGRGKCKECCIKISTEWNKDHPEKVKVYKDKWAKDNHEKLKARSAKWRKDHPEQSKVSSAKWRKDHPEQSKANNAKWAKDNPEKMKASKDRYTKNNYEKVKASNAKHLSSLCGDKSAITYLPRLPPEYKAFIDDNGFLNVKCYHCKEYYIPTVAEVQNCIKGFNTIGHDQRSIYCKQQCKDDCPVYNFKPRSIDPRSLLYNETFDPRELQGAWATAVKERDGYQCTKCDNPDNLPLHAHHIDPLALDYDAWELDNGITFCLDCHMEAHQEYGCSFSEIKEKKANCDM